MPVILQRCNLKSGSKKMSAKPMSRSQSSSQERSLARCHQLCGLEQTHVFPISLFYSNPPVFFLTKNAHENMIRFPVPILLGGAKGLWKGVRAIFFWTTPMWILNYNTIQYYSCIFIYAMCHLDLSENGFISQNKYRITGNDIEIWNIFWWTLFLAKPTCQDGILC